MSYYFDLKRSIAVIPATLINILKELSKFESVDFHSFHDFIK